MFVDNIMKLTFIMLYMNNSLDLKLTGYLREKRHNCCYVPVNIKFTGHRTLSSISQLGDENVPLLMITTCN